MNLYLVFIEAYLILILQVDVIRSEMYDCHSPWNIDGNFGPPDGKIDNKNITMTATIQATDLFHLSVLYPLRVLIPFETAEDFSPSYSVSPLFLSMWK